VQFNVVPGIHIMCFESWLCVSVLFLWEWARGGTLDKLTIEGIKS